MALSSTIGGTGTIGGKTYTTISKNTGGTITSSKGSQTSRFGSSPEQKYTISNVTSNNTKSSSSQSAGFSGTVRQYLAAGGSMPGSSTYTGGSSYVKGDIAGSGLYKYGSTAYDTVVYAVSPNKEQLTLFNPDRTTTGIALNPYSQNAANTPLTVPAAQTNSKWVMPVIIGGAALLAFLIFRKKR